MTIKEAVVRVLLMHGRPMRTCDIWAAIQERGYYKGKGKTPYKTFTAILVLDISKHGTTSTFVRHGFGLYGLRDRPVGARRTRD